MLHGSVLTTEAGKASPEDSSRGTVKAANRGGNKALSGTTGPAEGSCQGNGD